MLKQYRKTTKYLALLMGFAFLVCLISNGPVLTFLGFLYVGALAFDAGYGLARGRA